MSFWAESLVGNETVAHSLMHPAKRLVRTSQKSAPKEHVIIPVQT